MNKKIKNNKENDQNYNNLNTIDSYGIKKNPKNDNMIYIINSDKKKREAEKIAKIKELLNQDPDSESSDNKLLFNEKKKNPNPDINANSNFELFDEPRKKNKCF